MKKNRFKLYSLLLACSLCVPNALSANKVTQIQCENQGEEYIYAGGECIEYYVSEGEVESEINIIVHGTWDAGTNTLGRYAPFADNLSMATDITTIAVALPGYSGSSTNNFPALNHDGGKNYAADEQYIQFLSKLIEKFKAQFEAEQVNYIGHSAGAFMGSTLTGYKPGLINTMTSAGAGYAKKSDDKSTDKMISLSDFMDRIDKETKFLLVYGTEDKISPPQVTIDYAQALKKRGLNVQLVKVVGAPHLDLDMSDKSVEAIVEMLEE